MITREAITFNGKYVVLLNREVSSAANGRDMSSGFEEIIEEFLVAGNHPEWRIGSDLTISFPEEKIRGRVTTVNVDTGSSRTSVRVLYRKVATEPVPEKRARQGRRRG
jgi:hypothetical protein